FRAKYKLRAYPSDESYVTAKPLSGRRRFRVQHAPASVRFFGKKPRLTDALDKAGPVCLDDSCECLGNMGAVDELQACIARPARQLLFVNKPAMPIPKRAHAYVGSDPREHPIDRVVGKRKACTRAGKENISAKSHFASSLAVAGVRTGNVFGHF